MDVDEITNNIISAAIEVHKALGPGLLESVYEECMFYELTLRELMVDRQLKLSVNYKDVKLDIGYRLDLLVDNKVVAKKKSIKLCWLTNKMFSLRLCASAVSFILS